MNECNKILVEPFVLLWQTVRFFLVKNTGCQSQRSRPPVGRFDRSRPAVALIHEGLQCNISINILMDFPLMSASSYWSTPFLQCTPKQEMPLRRAYWYNARYCGNPTRATCISCQAFDSSRATAGDHGSNFTLSSRI